jgi:hypothetical protein
MLDLVKKVLASHKCQMDRSREQYARDLAGMPGDRLGVLGVQRLTSLAVCPLTFLRYRHVGELVIFVAQEVRRS